MRSSEVCSVLLLLVAGGGCQGVISGPASSDAEPGCAIGASACGTDCCSGAEICDESSGLPACVLPPTCADDLQNQAESDVDCGGSCPRCDLGQGCGLDDDCQSGACTLGTCQLCPAGTYRCFGNWVRICAADESAWEDVTHCDAIAGDVCNAATGACAAVEPTGNDSSNPTGTFYQFAVFTTANSVFLGGADVDSVVRPGPDGTGQNLIFVNRDGSFVDAYAVTILDSDGDGVPEPSQHPDNPDRTGPIEERVLTLVTSYEVPIGGTHNNELYAINDKIVFSRGTATPGALFQYDTIGGTVDTIISPPIGLWNQVTGYDDVNERWYTALPYDRWVYSFDPLEDEWVLEFAYPNLSGDHNDGLEVVTDPTTGVAYVYVSDMTSDFIAQYAKDSSGAWVQENLFHYNQAGAFDVEGMGFGAFNHFWATNEGYGSSSEALYEIGGGDIDDYVE